MIIKKAQGKMNDEYGGIIICEFIGPKPKMYSIRDISKKEKSVYKGHNSDIEYDGFKDIFFNKKVIRHHMKGIKPINHRMYTYESNKISLSAYDDKRYILDDGINLDHMDIKIYLNKIK